MSRTTYNAFHFDNAGEAIQTIEAMNVLPRRGGMERIFITYHGLPIKACGAFRRFCIDAGLKTPENKPTVTPSQMRDGAFTAAAEAGCSPELCKLLVGHKQSGKTDAYVKRNPKMVKPASDAVYAKYF